MSEVPTPPWMEGWSPNQPAPKGEVRPVGNPGWYPGMPSPNPKGRPAGITDRKSKLVQRMLEDAEGIVAVLIQNALEGDSNSASLILGRILPNIKAQQEKVQFEFDATAPVSSQVEMVLAAVASGQLAPDVAKQLTDVIASLSVVRQSEDLEARIAVLEEAKIG